MSVASCQPSWSLMHALLTLSSYVHSVQTPCNSSTGKHKNGIAETVVRHFVASLVDTLASGYEASEELSDAQANTWDLKFLRRLLALWTSDWDGLSKLDNLIEQILVCTPPETMIRIYVHTPLPIAVFQQFDGWWGRPFRTAYIAHPDPLSASSTPYTIATTDEPE
jgi:hypothetical protein